jgi:hypothetical protein
MALVVARLVLWSAALVAACEQPRRGTRGGGDAAVARVSVSLCPHSGASIVHRLNSLHSRSHIRVHTAVQCWGAATGQFIHFSQGQYIR